MRITAPLALVAALAFGAGALAAVGWTVHRDQINRFQISTPSPWVVIPGSRPAALKLARSLEHEGKLRQATLVRSYAADNYQSGENRVLDGVQYPIRTSPILTDFVLVKDHLPNGYRSDSNTLKAIGDALFSGLAKGAGVHMTTTKPVFLKLHGGNAVSLSGSSPAVGFGKGARTGFAIYVLLGPGGSEWQIEFRTDAQHLAGDSSLFHRIADSLSLQ